MQVSHVQDHVTHAVIGANAAQSFSVAATAEFFNVLSNTLYSNKPLAVVREVLCNAWDAHIAAGRTDKAVEVTLTREHLIIRDFGPGIPKDMMLETYCVYGGSTKQNDGQQTGGFGLGCKAPFAYVDHFEVTNCNANQKTIYRISKSSGEVRGLPGMMEIMDIPTTESGMQVKIEIQHPNDFSTFHRLIERIAGAGEMNVVLNGLKVPTLPLSQAKEGFLFTQDLKLLGEDNTVRVWVRYGNVLYPVAGHGAYHEAYQFATKILDSLVTRNGYGGNPWRLVFQAAPHTISVTPSRESLSMSERTIETLKGLLVAVGASWTSRGLREQQTAHREGIQNAVARMRATDMLEPSRKIYGFENLPTQRVVDNVGDAARIALQANYPNQTDFYENDISVRLRAIEQSGFGNRGLIQVFQKAWRAENIWRKPGLRRTQRPDWFQRHIVAPLVMTMKDQKELDIDRLFAAGRNDADLERRRGYNETEFTSVRKFKKNSLDGYLPFLRNFVVLSHNRLDINERLHKQPIMKWLGKTTDMLVYVVQRSEPKVEAARAFFKNQGFLVVDLTVRHASEPAPIVDRAPREYKPRKKGIPKASTMLPTGHVRISTDLAKADNADRIDTPEFVIKAAYKNDSQRFDPFSANASAVIVRLFGDKAGVVVNDTQAQKYITQGAKQAVQWLWEKVTAELKSNTRIQAYMAVKPSRITEGMAYYEKWPKWLDLVAEDVPLAAHYGIHAELTPADKDYLLLWEELRLSAPGLKKQIDEVSAFLHKTPIRPELLQLTAKIKRSKLLNLLVCSNIETLLNRSDPTPEDLQQQAKARDILIHAI